MREKKLGLRRMDGWMSICRVSVGADCRFHEGGKRDFAQGPARVCYWTNNGQAGTADGVRRLM